MSNSELSGKYVKVTLVIAGNINEYWSWCREKAASSLGIKDIKLNRSKAELKIGKNIFKYIGSHQHMRGFHNVNVEFIGTAFNKKNILEYERLAQIARLP